MQTQDVDRSVARRLALVVLMALVVFDFLKELLYGPLFSRGGITDFAYNFNLVVAFWLRGVSGLYTALDAREALRGLLGEIPLSVFPNPISPTEIIIWLPLLLVTEASLRVANGVWLIIGSALLSLGLYRALTSARLGFADSALLCCCFVLVCVSEISHQAVMLGLFFCSWSSWFACPPVDRS